MFLIKRNILDTSYFEFVTIDRQLEEGHSRIRRRKVPLQTGNAALRCNQSKHQLGSVCGYRDNESVVALNPVSQQQSSTRCLLKHKKRGKESKLP